MTFTVIKTRIMNLCGLSSTDADTRVGISINQHYRRITSMLGMDAARFVTRQVSMTVGVRTVVFTEIEKIDRIIDATDATAIRLLPEYSIHDLRSLQPGDSEPTKWALQNTDADSVTILTDTVPQTAYVLLADGWTTLSDLSGSDEPVFPESFHDVLTWSVASEEFLRKEKDKLALIYQQKADALLSDLRFHLADSPTHEIRQGGSQTSPISGSASGGSATVGSTNWTQTGLITFDRDPSAPFAVTASSAVVPNLDADKVDGVDIGTMAANRIVYGASATALQASANLTFNGTDFAIAATGKVYLDGGSNSYIHESSADVVSVVAGGTTSLTVTATGVTAGTNIRLTVGEASAVNAQHLLGGAFTGSTASRGVHIKPTLTLPANGEGSGLLVSAGTFVEAGSGTHALLATVDVRPWTVTAGAATVTNAATVYISDAMAATVSGANYALWVDAGATRLDGDVNVNAATATPAGGSTSARVVFGTTAGFGVYYGSGAPTVSAAQGSLYLRSDGSSTSTRAYINTDGGTTWTAITTAA